MSKKNPTAQLSKADLDSRTEELIDLCEKKKIRLTPQRVEIYKEVVSSSEHPDAETVYHRVRKRFTNISRDTVYRTLSLLEKEGLLSRLAIFCDRARFDANRESHHHFICLHCGTVSDFYSSVLDKFRPPKAVREIGKVKSAQMELRGTCVECAAAGKR